MRGQLFGDRIYLQGKEVMWRIAVAVLVLIGAVGIMTRKKDVSADATEQQAQYKYAEARIAISANGREMEMVAVGEGPTDAECTGKQGTNVIKGICAGRGPSCKVVSFDCTNTLEQRYVNMLARKPMNVPYTHIVVPANGRENNAAIVGWGLTADESLMLCRGMGQMSSGQLKASCITSGG
ncbi:hypothetical protein [Tahibacter amnicola]|uniref:Uncharacterized protein n=1 Tax=Tahibacter amnicola TaxID=2976241 RepID=A0ABY6BL91_9GAMM|nr:hypothetical protein [Tahibacter amnicola]UXI70198.1 hypothetical protein N4264_11365 [Tahibacter amnicola]